MTRAFAALALALVASGCADHRAPARPEPVSDAASPVAEAGVNGFVEGADGVTVADAVVALVGAKGRALAIVRTDAKGRFQVPRPMEPFAITATSPRGMAAYVPPASTAATSYVLRLGRAAEGLAIDGTLAMHAGVPAATYAVAARISDDEGDLFHAPVEPDGRFHVVVPPGRYTVKPEGHGFLARPANLEGSAEETKRVTLEASLRAPAPQEVVHWLGEHAMPIASTEPGTPTDDLDALASTLASARVIGAGEATHGTREYFRLKHRLLERLVSRHGLTLLAMEANFSDAERIDAWLQDGKGSVDDAMKGLFTVWRTEEIRDVLVWMRAWNADPKHPTRLHLRGYDVQGARASVAALRAFLHRVDPAREAELLAPIAPMEVAPSNRGMVTLGDAEAETVRAGIARIAERLDGYHASALVKQHARVVEQARVRFAAKTDAEQFAARDRAMAENVVWLSERLGKGERMLVWAHNGHVQLDATALPGANMGSRLRERLGSAYIVAGFVLDEGTYRAWPKPDEPTIVDVRVGPREPGWAAEGFARAGHAAFAVDLRGAPPGAVRDWLFEPHVLHSCGWLVSEWQRRGGIESLGRLFDVAIYVADTTSARQLPKR